MHCKTKILKKEMPIYKKDSNGEVSFFKKQLKVI